jgi:hypothetical protein
MLEKIQLAILVWEGRRIAGQGFIGEASCHSERGLGPLAVTVLAIPLTRRPAATVCAAFERVADPLDRAHVDTKAFRNDAHT